MFEVQENSDVTFRLYDWDRTDPKTGKRRDLQVDAALACIDFDQVAIGPVKPVTDSRHPNTEKVFDDAHFVLWRTTSQSAFPVGVADELRILVCTDGGGKLVYDGTDYGIKKGDVMLLPAVVGPCNGEADGQITFLEIAIPGTNLSAKLP